MLAFWVEWTPDAPALIVPGMPPITYETLWRHATGLAESLREHGIGHQDRVVLLLPEGPTLATALLGTMSAAIAMPLDTALTAAELSGALQGFNAARAIVTPTIPASARECLCKYGMAIFELHSDDALDTFALTGETVGRLHRGTWPRPEDIVVVSQMSGTTGKPKRVPRTEIFSRVAEAIGICSVWIAAIARYPLRRSPWHLAGRRCCTGSPLEGR